MSLRLWLALWIFLVTSLSCRAAPEDEGDIRLTILQVNDVYEIAPLGNGEGGLARVAALKKQLKNKNENTWMILDGDLFSPSALGLATVDGERLAGRQIVDVMRKVGLDYATFGNHEFDIDEAQFGKRLRESQKASQPGDTKITWLSSNVFDRQKKPFENVPSHVVVSIGAVKIGMFGLTLDSNKRDYVQYDPDYVTVARNQIKHLREQEKVDILIAITHLARSQDSTLAKSVSGIDLILGGHEHEHMRVPVYRTATDSTVIYKADANARSAYIHDLVFNTRTKQLKIDSRLESITAKTGEDDAVADVVKEWEEKAFEGFRKAGLHPEAPVATPTKDLDGLETSVRTHRTQLTKLLAEGMRHISANITADLAIFNGGSIRIDDVLPAGVTLREYDVIRIMPFGGVLLPVSMKGDRLQILLDAGQRSKGAGGFLQTSQNVAFGAAGSGTFKWVIDNQPLDPQRDYLVAINDYVLTGRETFLDDPFSEVYENEKAHLVSSYIHLLQNRRLAVFDAGVNVAVLDQKRVPDALRQALKKTYDEKKIQELILQSGGEVRVRTPGSEWLINETVGGDRTYFVRKVGEKLVAYDTFGTLGEALNDALEKYVHVDKGQIVAVIDSELNSDVLDAKMIPDGMRKAFAKAAQDPKNKTVQSIPPLSAVSVKVSVSQKGSQWLITETVNSVNNYTRTYFVKRYGKKLIVYNTLDMRQALIEQLKKAYP